MQNSTWRSGRRWVAGGSALCALAASQTAMGQVYNPADPSTHPAPIVKDGTTVSIVDFANAPLSGTGGSITSFGAHADSSNELGRLSFLRSEPTAGASGALQTAESERFFVADNNRNLYILNKSAAPTSVGAGFTPYLNMQSIFPEFDNNPGYAGGLVTFQFDPGYSDPTSAGYGKFYTVHTENIAGTPPSSAKPLSTNMPGLSNTATYSLTTPMNPPASTVARQAVLVEWTDTNPQDSVFQGTAREVMRVGFNGNLHPMGDLIFNPNAKPGDADYRNMYIAVGDGGSGESTSTAAEYTTPQRLDSVQGKVLRITPDVNLHPTDEFGSNGNNTYRIPSSGADKNPFVGVNSAAVKDEVYAFGFRNIHRLSWDPVSGKMIGNDIGLYTYEEVNIIEKGGNYGWSEREGTRTLLHTGGGSSTSLPGTRTTGITGTDTIPLRVSDTTYVASLASGTTTTNVANAQQSAIRYPVAEYFQTEGDSMSSGFVYRGTALQGLQGKYVFGDITTGRVFFADFNEMMAANDFDPSTLAGVHELSFEYNGQPTTLYDLIVQQFAVKGGSVSAGVLPGFADNVGGIHSGAFDPANQGTDADGNPIYDTNANEHASNAGFTPGYGGGRADIRLAEGGDGEIYILTKADGMIRELTGVVSLGTAVPEPASLGVLVGGAAWMLVVRRRR